LAIHSRASCTLAGTCRHRHVTRSTHVQSDSAVLVRTVVVRVRTAPPPQPPCPLGPRAPRPPVLTPP
jgi:hypothetical protein